MRKRRSTRQADDLAAWLPFFQTKVRSPVCIAMSSPRLTAELVRVLELSDIVAWQMDLFQAERLHAELAERDCQAKATVAVAADLWDVAGAFQTVLFPVEPRGERSLKLDVLEQAY